MARANKSLLLAGLRGRVGDIVIKQYRYGTVVTKLPDMSKVKTTKLQKKKRKRFKEAVAYAKQILADPEKKAIYKTRIKKGKTIYHSAISEFLKNTP